MSDDRALVTAAMRQINDAWMAGRIDDMAATIHDEIVMVIPGFAGSIRGQAPFLAGFRDFRDSAEVQEFSQGEHQVDIVGRTAVVSFPYEMLYERASVAYRVTGRDLWIFEKHGVKWLAVWRTMLDLNETAT